MSVWVDDAIVQVPGDPRAKSNRRTWHRAAVLRIFNADDPDGPVPAYRLYWFNQHHPIPQCFSEDLTASHMRMRIGADAVTFGARPVVGSVRLGMQVVAVAWIWHWRYRRIRLILDHRSM